MIVRVIVKISHLSLFSHSHMTQWPNGSARFRLADVVCFTPLGEWRAAQLVPRLSARFDGPKAERVEARGASMATRGAETWSPNESR